MWTYARSGELRRSHNRDCPLLQVRSSTMGGTFGVNLFPVQSMGKTWNPHSFKALERLALPAKISTETG